MREIGNKMEMSGRMSETQLQIFKQTWTSLWERFDQTAMNSIKEQAQVDSETFINNRLLKSMEGIQVDENFLNLFKYQVQVLYTLFFHFKDMSAQVSQQTQVAQILEAKNVQLIEEDKESKQQLFDAQEKLFEAEKAKEEMRESMDRAISEKISYKIQLDEKREKVEILTEENGSLRTKI